MLALFRIYPEAGLCSIKLTIPFMFYIGMIYRNREEAMDQKEETAVRKSLKKDIWIMSSIIGTSVTFFWALLSSPIKIENSYALLLSAIFFAIALPVCVTILSICVAVDWDLEKSPLIPLYNSKFYNYVSIVPIPLTCLGLIFLLFHLSFIVGLIFLITSALVYWAFKKANTIANT
ncbi:MAG: hypothetical protein MI799_11995 [Desulfobacterales bacterium]|nr:hypothetical protein [Desulfobacterales bacterium]